MKTNNIFLRKVEPTDTTQMYEWENDRSLWYVSGTYAPLPMFDIEEFCKAENQDVHTQLQLRLVICHNENKMPVGYVDLFDIDFTNRRAGVGILIGDKTQQNKGFAQQAIQLIIKQAFEILKLHQLFCNIHESNKASIHVFEKLGFQISGRLKDWSLKGDVFEDVLIFQLIG